jgi:integrase
VKEIQQLKGVLHFRLRGKGEKERYIPVHPGTQRLVSEYLDAAGHREDREGPLFRPVKNNVTGTLAKPLHSNSVYEKIVRRYAREVGITLDVHGFCVHSLQATAATNARERGGYCKSAGVDGARAYFHHQDLRPPPPQAGGESHVSRAVLKRKMGSW